MPQRCGCWRCCHGPPLTLPVCCCPSPLLFLGRAAAIKLQVDGYSANLAEFGLGPAAGARSSNGPALCNVNMEPEPAELEGLLPLAARLAPPGGASVEMDVDGGELSLDNLFLLDPLLREQGQLAFDPDPAMDFCSTQLSAALPQLPQPQQQHLEHPQRVLIRGVARQSPAVLRQWILPPPAALLPQWGPPFPPLAPAPEFALRGPAEAGWGSPGLGFAGAGAANQEDPAAALIPDLLLAGKPGGPSLLEQCGGIPVPLAPPFSPQQLPFPLLTVYNAQAPPVSLKMDFGEADLLALLNDSQAQRQQAQQQQPPQQQPQRRPTGGDAGRGTVPTLEELSAPGRWVRAWAAPPYAAGCLGGSLLLPGSTTSSVGCLACQGYGSQGSARPVLGLHQCSWVVGNVVGRPAQPEPWFAELRESYRLPLPPAPALPYIQGGHPAAIRPHGL